jgi:hypothetical protein
MPVKTACQNKTPAAQSCTSNWYQQQQSIKAQATTYTSIDNMQLTTEGQPQNPSIYQSQKGSINGVVPITRTNNTGNTQATVPTNNTKKRQQGTTRPDQFSISSDQFNPKIPEQQGQSGGWYQKFEPRITHSHSKPDRYELIPRPHQRIGGSQG